MKVIVVYSLKYTVPTPDEIIKEVYGIFHTDAEALAFGHELLDTKMDATDYWKVIDLITESVI